MTLRRAAVILGVAIIIPGIGYLAVGISVKRHARTRIQHAMYLVQAGSTSEAREKLELLLWYKPDHSPAWFAVGLSYLKDRSYRKAIGGFERVAVDSPIHRDAELNLAVSLMAIEHPERAENVLRDHLHRYPDSVPALLRLNELLLTELRSRESLHILHEFLKKNSDQSLTTADRLTVLRQLLIAEFAPPVASACLASLESSNKAWPHQATVQCALGVVYWKSGQIERAEVFLRDAVSIMPGNPRLRLILCEFLLIQQRIDDAKRELELLPISNTRSQSNDDVVLWSTRSRLAEYQQQFESALKFIDKALIVRPGEREYLSRRARLLQRLGQTEQAAGVHVQVHELAAGELAMWDLATSLEEQTVTAADCRRVAQVYSSLNNRDLANRWLALANEFDSSAASPLDHAWGRQ